MPRFQRTAICRGILAASALTISGVGIAQDKDITNLGIEEVVVTAQKRAEDAQAVPISISSLSQTDIERRGVNNAQDLINTIPSMGGFQPPGGKGALSISLRGVSSGSPSNLSIDTSTGVYLDGVLLGKQIGSSLDVMELERIEVLRGPQGTLYGRNSTGGAVNFITRKPTGEFGGKITGIAGNENLWGLRAALDTGTLGTAGEGAGTLKASFGAQTRKRDGWYDNTAAVGGELDDLDRQAWRGALRWEPTDSITVDYSYDHSELDEANVAQVPVGLTPLKADGSSRIAALQGYVQAGEDAKLGFGPLAAAATTLGGDATFNRWLQSSKDMLAQFESLGDGDRPSKAASDVPNFTTSESDGHNLTLSWKLDDAGMLGDVEFKSISGWRQVKAHNVGDLDGFDNTITPGGGGALNDSALGAFYLFYFYQGQYPQALLSYPRAAMGKLWGLVDQYGGAFFTQDASFDYDQFSQELQMVGGTDCLQYAVGLYYFEDDGSFANYRLAAQPVGGINSTAYDNDTEAKAFYTQVTWTPPVLDNRLSLTAGYRRTEEEKGVTYKYLTDGGLFDGSPLYFNVDMTYTGDLSPAATYGDSFDQSFSNDSGSVTVAYQLTDDTNMFLRWSTGYRSGGYNGEIYNNPFEEESIEQWELGLKSDILPGTLRLNASVFTFQYDDLQVSQIQVSSTGQTTSFIGNAGQAERWGAEVEMQWAPMDDLMLSMGYSHVGGDFDEFPPQCAGGLASDPNDTTCIQTANLAVRGISPDNTFSITGDWVFARADWADFILHLESFWQDDTYASTLWTATYGDGKAGNPAVPYIYDPIVIKDRNIVNGRIGIENVQLGSGTLRASLWGRNLTDEDYNSFGINFATLGIITEQYGEPRSYGVEVSWEF